MSTGATVAVVVAVLVVAAIIAAVLMLPRGGAAGTGLKRRFGPEYERTLARHDGDSKATRQELAERVKRYGDIERQPVGAREHEEYVARWSAVQARFVDEPAQAVAEADRLIAGLAAERGFPAANSPEHFDALSVHHPYEIQGYRQAHAVAEGSGEGGGRGLTEDLRQALVAARAFFEQLLGDAKSAATPALNKRVAEEPEASEADVEPDTDAATDVDAEQPDEVEPDRRRPLSDRFAALTGSRRGHADEDV